MPENLKPMEEEIATALSDAIDGPPPRDKSPFSPPPLRGTSKGQALLHQGVGLKEIPGGTIRERLDTALVMAKAAIGVSTEIAYGLGVEITEKDGQPPQAPSTATLLIDEIDRALRECNDILSRINKAL